MDADLYRTHPALAAGTEKRYTETAQLRESLKYAQKEFIANMAFPEPGGNKGIKLAKDKESFLKNSLGFDNFDIEDLKKAITGQKTEDEFGNSQKPVYNLKRYDESLDDDGIERIAHAAKKTHTVIATPFFERALLIR